MLQNFLSRVRARAREHPARIVFPETFDERTLRACSIILKEGYCHPVLLGEPNALGAQFAKLGLKNVRNFSTLNMNDNALSERYAQAFFELRKNHGVTIDDAREAMKNHNYFGVMAVQAGDADGLISGANAPSSDTLRPALQIIKTKEKFHKVSGFFFMVLEHRLLLFADCMVNIEPSADELADIAIDTAETAKRFGIIPRIAMLSFSTHGSAKHPSADRMREAAARVNHFRPDLACEGEMQVDAALVPSVCKIKFPESKLMGTANILIFPNLDAANIAYKLVERLGGAHAIGPILQGLQKPINDLSRGASVQDIVDLAAITSVEARELEIHPL